MVFRHKIKTQTTALCKMLLLHTILGLFLKGLIPSFRSSSVTMVPVAHIKHTTWHSSTHHWVLPYSPSSVGTTSRNNPLEGQVFSALQCTSAAKKGRISNHSAWQWEDGQHPELALSVSDDYKHNYRLLNKALDQ